MPKIRLQHFMIFFLENVENIFPETSIEVKYKNRHSWMPNSLLKTIKANHVLYKLSVTNKPTKINWSTYTNSNNKLNSIKRKAERDHYSNQLEINKSDMKKTWKIMKTVIVQKKIEKKAIFNINNKTIDSGLQTSNEFNCYFVSIGPKLASHQKPTTLNPLKSLQFNANSMGIHHIEESEVVRIINSLNNSSPGWHCIPAKLAKRVLNYYIKPLTFLINQSFHNGIFPDELKLVKVIPIYKSGSTMELNNYRPISVLNIFSKTFERLMYNKLIKFLDKYNILDQNQFRQGHSTHHALITPVDKINKSRDNGDIVIGVFIDLKRHSIHSIIKLKEKVYYYGIRGNTLKWFESYLTNRSQYVLFNGEKSYIRDITYGVPQVSIHRLLLFRLYINDFSGVSDKLFCVLFVDDTNIFLSGKDINK